MLAPTLDTFRTFLKDGDTDPAWCRIGADWNGKTLWKMVDPDHHYDGPSSEERRSLRKSRTRPLSRPGLCADEMCDFRNAGMSQWIAPFTIIWSKTAGLRWFQISSKYQAASASF